MTQNMRMALVRWGGVGKNRMEIPKGLWSWETAESLVMRWVEKNCHQVIQRNPRWWRRWRWWQWYQQLTDNMTMATSAHSHACTALPYPSPSSSFLASVPQLLSTHPCPYNVTTIMRTIMLMTRIEQCAVALHTERMIFEKMEMLVALIWSFCIIYKYQIIGLYPVNICTYVNLKKLILK